MKPLRNILLLGSYITAILSIIVTFVLLTKVIWIPIIAIVFVVIAYFIVKTERRHSRGPAILAVLALVLTFVIPEVLKPENADDEEFEQMVDQSEEESLDEINEAIDEGIINFEPETETADNQNTADNNVDDSEVDQIELDPELQEAKTIEEIPSTEVEERGLAAPVLTD